MCCSVAVGASVDSASTVSVLLVPIEPKLPLLPLLLLLLRLQKDYQGPTIHLSSYLSIHPSTVVVVYRIGYYLCVCMVNTNDLFRFAERG